MDPGVSSGLGGVDPRGWKREGARPVKANRTKHNRPQAHVVVGKGSVMGYVGSRVHGRRESERQCFW